MRVDELLERMAALTGHLKTFARKTPGGLRERIELGHVVEQALQLLAVRIRTEGVDIRQALESPAWVLGDAIRLEQVLVNLIRNALDAVANSAQPRIELTLRRDGEHWCLEVADNGPGIDEAHLASVFDPFFTTKPVGEGLGLGLAVSYGIVHELGGRLRRRQPALRRRRIPAQPAGRQRRIQTMSETILFVDDEAAIRDAVQQWLQLSGFEVRLCQQRRRVPERRRPRAAPGWSSAMYACPAPTAWPCSTACSSSTATCR